MFYAYSSNRCTVAKEGRNPQILFYFQFHHFVMAPSRGEENIKLNMGAVHNYNVQTFPISSGN